MAQTNNFYPYFSSNTTFHDTIQIVFDLLVCVIVYISIRLTFQGISLQVHQSHWATSTIASLLGKIRPQNLSLLSVVYAQTQRRATLGTAFNSKRISRLMLSRASFTRRRTNLFVNAKPHDGQRPTICALESKGEITARCGTSLGQWPPKKDDAIDDVVQRALPSDLLRLWQRHETLMKSYCNSFLSQPSKRRKKCTCNRQQHRSQKNILAMQENTIDYVTRSRNVLYLFARDVLSYYEKEYGNQRNTPEAERITYLRQAISDFTSA